MCINFVLRRCIRYWGYVAWNNCDKSITNYEQGGLWKRTVVICFKVSSWYSTGRTEENNVMSSLDWIHTIHITAVGAHLITGSREDLVSPTPRIKPSFSACSFVSTTGLNCNPKRVWVFRLGYIYVIQGEGLHNISSYLKGAIVWDRRNTWYAGPHPRHLEVTVGSVWEQAVPRSSDLYIDTTLCVPHVVPSHRALKERFCCYSYISDLP
jgi:hypothetical protein